MEIKNQNFGLKRKENNIVTSLKNISLNQNQTELNNLSITEPNEKSKNDIYNCIIDYLLETNKKIQKNLKETQNIDNLLENFHNNEEYNLNNYNKLNYKEISKQNKEEILKSINRKSEERMKNYKLIFKKINIELNKIKENKTQRIENLKNNNTLFYPKKIFERKKLFKRQQTTSELEKLRKQNSFQINLLKKRYSLSFHCSRMKNKKYTPLKTNNSLNKKIYLRNEKLTPLQVYTTSLITKKIIKKIKRPISSSPEYLTEKNLNKSKNNSYLGYICKKKKIQIINNIPFKTEISGKYKINEALVKKSLSNRGSFIRKHNF
jgi:hypothetical protein